MYQLKRELQGPKGSIMGFIGQNGAALSHGAKLLIMDEATTGLDPAASNALKNEKQPRSLNCGALYQLFIMCEHIAARVLSA